MAAKVIRRVIGEGYAEVVTSASLPIDALETWLRGRLVQPLPGAGAQRRFAPNPSRKGWQPELVPPHERQAAALILLYPGEDGRAMLPLTLRRDDLPVHPGQVSLPGGSLDPGEAHLDTALREAEEEIGVSPADVRIIGPMSSLWVIVSGFVVFPFLGVAHARPDFRPQAREVAKLLEVPLAHVLDRSRTGWERRAREGLVISYPYFDLAGHKVWGATGMMLSEFAALFEPDFGPRAPE
jgi:8-oxo-dGTP pyrophosphatase MutT (NUDIX family)